MEEVVGTPFDTLNFPTNSDLSIKGKTLYLTKWNWEYSECLKFQKTAQEIIQKNRDHKIYIFCNHPHCFTLGRGNERGQKDLIDFDINIEEKLKYPVHKIHRGGGLTFHFPGQWIFYPIVSINKNYTLDDHMCWLLKSVKSVLKESFGVEKAMAAKKLMGVWIDRQKLASIGVGLSRFVTEHGLALNLQYDENMFNEMRKTNPCGMNPTTYTALDKISHQIDSNLIESFHKQYLNKN